MSLKERKLYWYSFQNRKNNIRTMEATQTSQDSIQCWPTLRPSLYSPKQRELLFPLESFLRSLTQFPSRHCPCLGSKSETVRPADHTALIYALQFKPARPIRGEESCLSQWLHLHNKDRPSPSLYTLNSPSLSFSILPPTISPSLHLESWDFIIQGLRFLIQDLSDSELAVIIIIF